VLRDHPARALMQFIQVEQLKQVPRFLTEVPTLVVKGVTKNEIYKGQDVFRFVATQLTSAQPQQVSSVSKKQSKNELLMLDGSFSDLAMYDRGNLGNWGFCDGDEPCTGKDYSDVNMVMDPMITHPSQSQQSSQSQSKKKGRSDDLNARLEALEAERQEKMAVNQPIRI
jgi:hypothetical protein